MSENSAEGFNLTEKQKAWIVTKAANRSELPAWLRGIRGPATNPVRRRRRIGGACLTCGHTMKHHKQSGRCRRGCDCAKGTAPR